ncbi:GmrSD restriction endonuclease domain-containing protein [Microlunatus soli]|uniref:GmrSD restriction endonucleases C-terminal domain-containing protein n=1 Tax=Microlunatus soli TaxID=630515 RepID=A0A1H1TG02_9ACTN|nr:DUF1524 domain-containing protein [Microlunatus soli]SDS59084.1 Protein of unknown function [Microlunatus soli]
MSVPPGGGRSPVARPRISIIRRTLAIIGGVLLALFVALLIIGLAMPDPPTTVAPSVSASTTGPSASAATSSAAASPDANSARPSSARPTSERPSPSRSARTTPDPLPRKKNSTSPTSARAPADSALAAVAALTVKGRAAKTGYVRARFGSAWPDSDDNGCRQRDDVLNRDLRSKTFDGCKVLTGVLDDPYTGKTILFRRGQRSSAEVQIDHVVALSDAWQKGAQQWSQQTRVSFANDTLNLLAVGQSVNASKGDGDTATWLPPNKPFRCQYVARQVAVKKNYGLSVTAAERDAMVRVLSGCPKLRLPVRTAIPAHPAPRPKPEPPAPKPPVRQPSAAAGGGGNCAPGYDPCIPPYPPDLDCSDVDGPISVSGDDPHGLDGDGDGVACESS